MNPSDLYFLARKLRALAEAGQKAHSRLSLAQALVLEEARARPGVSVGEIASLHELAQSLVSTAVLELVGQGLLVATPDTKDRRRTALTATATGEALPTRGDHDALEASLRPLNARDRKSARHGLELVLRAMGRR